MTNKELEEIEKRANKASEGHNDVLLLIAEVRKLQAYSDALAAVYNEVIDLIEYSSKSYHNSTLWEDRSNDSELADKWQALYNRRGDIEVIRDSTQNIREAES